MPFELASDSCSSVISKAEIAPAKGVTLVAAALDVVDLVGPVTLVRQRDPRPIQHRGIVSLECLDH